MAPVRTAYSGTEVTVHSLYQLVPQPPGEVEVDVRQRRHLFRYEAFQREAPLQGIDVAYPYEVPHEQRHGGAASPSGRPLLHRRLRAHQPALLHDELREKRDLPVEQQEPREVEAFYQPELLTQAAPRRAGRTDPPYRRMAASRQSRSRKLCGVYPVRHVGLRQPVSQVVGEVEAAPLGDAQGVRYGLQTLGEEPLHLGMGLQVQVVVRLEVWKSLIDGGIEPCGRQRVLEPVTFRRVVVDVVGGDHGDAHLPGDVGQLPVALRVTGQEVLLKLHVHRTGAVPVSRIASEARGPPHSWRLPIASLEIGPSRPPVSSTMPLRMVGQVCKGSSLGFLR